MAQFNRRFKRPPSASFSEEEGQDFDKSSVRRATVYDAVAGAITQTGFTGSKVAEQRRANQPLGPDEVLFKKLNAPTRYEEKDYYFAHRNLPQDQKLPDGDLLGALHGYISKLYSRTQEQGQQHAWKCMDETALIALGILLEETAKETLGETGDLALAEAAMSDEEKAFADAEDEETEDAPPRSGSHRSGSEVSNSSDSDSYSSSDSSA